MGGELSFVARLLSFVATVLASSKLLTASDSHGLPAKTPLPYCTSDTLRMYCMQQTMIGKRFEQLHVYVEAQESCYPHLEPACQIEEKTLNTLLSHSRSKKGFINDKFQLQVNCWQCVVKHCPTCFAAHVMQSVPTPAPTPYRFKSDSCCSHCTHNKYSDKLISGGGWCSHCPRGQFPEQFDEVSMEKPVSPCEDCPKGYYSAIMLESAVAGIIKAVSYVGAHRCYHCPRGKYGTDVGGGCAAAPPTPVPTPLPTQTPSPAPTSMPSPAPTSAPTTSPTICATLTISGLPVSAPKYNAMGIYSKAGPTKYDRVFSNTVQFLLKKVFQVGHNNSKWQIAVLQHDIPDSLKELPFLEVEDEAEDPTAIVGDWHYVNTINHRHTKPMIFLDCPTTAPTLYPTQTPAPTPYPCSEMDIQMLCLKNTRLSQHFVENDAYTRARKQCFPSLFGRFPGSRKHCLIDDKQLHEVFAGTHDPAIYKQQRRAIEAECGRCVARSCRSACISPNVSCISIWTSI